MPESIDTSDVMSMILQFGRFGFLVIAGLVAMMLFISFLDPHPRTKHSVDDQFDGNSGNQFEADHEE